MNIGIGIHLHFEDRAIEVHQMGLIEVAITGDFYIFTQETNAYR